jgi:multicomponent Na+:H+ antiporter subunit B
MRALRLGLFLAGAAGLAGLLAWAFVDLPAFGEGRSVYASVVDRVALPERMAPNAVTTVVFDVRGLDTLLEEAILFAAAAGVAMLLRDAHEGETAARRDAVRSDAVRALGMLLAPFALVLGLYTIAHGHLTPGGGFQGGVVVAAAVVLVYVAGRGDAFDRIAPTSAWDAVEGAGVGAFVVVGLCGLAAGGQYLENVFPLGVRGALAAAGTIPVLSWSAGIAVAAAFVLLFREFLDQLRDEES